MVHPNKVVHILDESQFTLKPFDLETHHQQSMQYIGSNTHMQTSL